KSSLLIGTYNTTDIAQHQRACELAAAASGEVGVSPPDLVDSAALGAAHAGRGRKQARAVPAARADGVPRSPAQGERTGVARARHDRPDAGGRGQHVQE